MLFCIMLLLLSQLWLAFQVIDIRNPNTGSFEYRVHYAGWNTRYDEWIKCDSIISVIGTPAADSATPAAGKQKQSSAAILVILLCFVMLIFRTLTLL